MDAVHIGDAGTRRLLDRVAVARPTVRGGISGACQAGTWLRRIGAKYEYCFDTDLIPSRSNTASRCSSARFVLIAFVRRAWRGEERGFPWGVRASCPVNSKLHGVHTKSEAGASQSSLTLFHVLPIIHATCDLAPSRVGPQLLQRFPFLSCLD
ncbi:hypothetical protein VTK73DRAFT_5761 [Phialemonium thermophilum]|uniref:Uncharacterized protein n=1 Tax=Phialemonium thermophilum TaxID=223376 RepID=A0ABR3WLY9_9PEZI